MQLAVADLEILVLGFVFFLCHEHWVGLPVLETVLYDTCIPLDKVDQPSQQDGTAFINWRQELSQKVTQSKKDTYIRHEQFLMLAQNLDHLADKTQFDFGGVK